MPHGSGNQTNHNVLLKHIPSIVTGERSVHSGQFLQLLCLSSFLTYALRCIGLQESHLGFLQLNNKCTCLSLGLSGFEGSRGAQQRVCSHAYSLGLLHVVPVLPVFGMFRHNLLCEAQGLRRILDFVKRWTGSSEMWLCNGERHVTIEALHGVMH